MKTIFKYDIPDTHEFTLMMPEGAVLLKVELQFGHPKLWALVSPSAEVPVKFIIYGTGQIIEREHLRYIATFLVNHGEFVWHLFQDIKPELFEVKNDQNKTNSF